LGKPKSEADVSWNLEAGLVEGPGLTEATLREDLAEKPELLVWRDGPDGALLGTVWMQPKGEGVWYLGLLAAGDRSEDDDGFLGCGDGFGEGCVRGEVGPVFFADEEAEEGAALVGDVVADGAAEHGVAGLEGVECGGEGDGGGDVEDGLVGGEVGEAAEVDGQF
jgi:hypothetical protein